ncbi:MAG: hypothetical protein WBD36_12575 [Bacteroidota bacterium]
MAQNNGSTIQRRGILWFLFVCSIGVEALHGQPKLETPIHALVSQGIDLTLRQQYSQADSIFRLLAEKYPDNPAGYLYQAAVIQAQSIDFETPIDQAPFDSLLELGIEASKKMIEQGNHQWGSYFLGTAYGYDAYARAERGDWFGGVRKGLSAATEFENVIEQDSTFYDAYVGAGTYYYWKSRKTEFLHWLPFVVDSRPLGVRMLEQCARGGEYNRFAAMSALVSIFLDMADYKNAEEWSRLALEQYSSNRIFLWGLSTALHKMQRFREAASVYETLLAQIVAERPDNPYNEIVCRLNLVGCRLSVNDPTGVRDEILTILSFEHSRFPEKFKSRAKEKFSIARRIGMTYGITGPANR